MRLSKYSGVWYLFYPLYVAVDLLSNLKIDLSAINITCDGAQAPMELVMNIFIMGLVIIVIRAITRIPNYVKWVHS